MPYKVLSETGATVIPATTLGNPLVSVGETLQSLRTELDRMLTGRDDVDTTRLNLWINWAYVDLASSLDIDDLKGSMGFNTVVGADLYKLPYEVMATRMAAVVDTVTYGSLGGIPLRKTDLNAWRMRSDQSDEPREYFRERNLLVLWPTPKAVRSIGLDFWIRPVKMVNDTDSPILPLEWHEAILLNARKKAFSALQEFEKAMVAENDFINLVRRKEDRDEREDDGRIVTSSVPRRKIDLLRNSRVSDFNNPDLG